MGDGATNFPVLQKKIMENIESRFGKTWDNVEEVRDAVQSLVWKLNQENDEDKWMPPGRPDNNEHGKCLMWNFDQYSKKDERTYRKYMDDCNYSGL